MRLIDADALRQVLEVYSEKDSLGHTAVQLCDAMPSVDAVRVVRCRECVLREKCFKDCKPLYDPDWFCGDGERREE